MVVTKPKADKWSSVLMKAEPKPSVAHAGRGGAAQLLQCYIRGRKDGRPAGARNTRQDQASAELTRRRKRAKAPLSQVKIPKAYGSCDQPNLADLGPDAPEADFSRRDDDASRECKRARQELEQIGPCTQAQIAESFSSVAEANTAIMAPQAFYGAGRRISATSCGASFARLLREIRLNVLTMQRITPSEVVWTTFPRQEMAITFSDNYANNSESSPLAIFTYQGHATGQRRFLVTTYQEFSRRYFLMDPAYRHHYEIIREGFPCHLYYDLEFSRACNPDADESSMVDDLLDLTKEYLKEAHGLECAMDNAAVELDSSTQEKFSRHVIIHVPGASFKSNYHVGHIVKQIVQRIHHNRTLDPRCERLFVWTEETKAACQPTSLFVDLAVYSRNRSFRLPYSSKAGKKAVLKPTRRYKCCKSTDPEVLAASFICQINKSEGATLLTSGTAEDNHLDVPSRVTSSLRGTRTVASSGYSASPFPLIDTFIEKMAYSGGIQGKVHSWHWFADCTVMVYNMCRNRFCENVNRPHKSNNVMYVVDFRMAGYYQRCHDPDCQGFRSDVRPLPRCIIPPHLPLSQAPHEPAPCEVPAQILALK
eukprot:SM000012S25430  [mRNA]  locus=s12:999459:1003153:- [translate_table: standard]